MFRQIFYRNQTYYDKYFINKKKAELEELIKKQEEQKLIEDKLNEKMEKRRKRMLMLNIGDVDS